MAQAVTKVSDTGKSDVASNKEVAPFESLRRDVERLFEEFRPFFWNAPFMPRSNELALSETGRNWLLNPAFDVVENEKAYEIAAELPGVDEKSVEVKLNGHLLTIKGEKSEQKTDNNSDYHLSERRFGSFQRSFRLPHGVDQEKIEATFVKGVLTVRLPKNPDAQNAERKITIDNR